MRGDRPSGLDGLSRLDGFGNDPVEPDDVPLERPPFVEPGEEQEIVDQEAHALRFASDPAHRAREVVRPRRCSAGEELGIRTDRGQRGPQLVRRVGHEAPELLLRRLAFLEGCLDLREHRVQREPEAADLGLFVDALDALRKVARGDAPRRRGDGVERPEAEPYHPEPERRERGKDRCRDEQLDEEEPVERPVHVAQRRGDDEHRPRTGLDRGANAVATVSVDGRDGEVAHALEARAGRLRDRDRPGQARRRQRRLPGEVHLRQPLDDDRAVERADLHGEPAPQPLRPRIFDRLVVGGERAVRAADEERAKRRVRDDVGGDEPHRAEGDDAHDEARPQRQPAEHALPRPIPACSRPDAPS